MVTIAVDAMGGDHAPKAEVEGAIRAARGSRGQSHPGGPARRRPRANWRMHDGAGESAHRDPSRQRAGHHGGQRRQGGPHQARQLHPRGLPAGARRHRAGLGLGRQHRRRHGHRQNGAGNDSRRGPARAGLGVSHAEGTPVVRGGRGRQRRLFRRSMLAQFAVMGDIYSRVIFCTRTVRAWACSRSAKRNTRATI